MRLGEPPACPMASGIIDDPAASLLRRGGGGLSARRPVASHHPAPGRPLSNTWWGQATADHSHFSGGWRLLNGSEAFSVGKFVALSISQK